MGFPMLHWLRATPDALRPPAREDKAPRADLSVREDVAAVIYERFFPTLSWGDATRSGKISAYASADAALHVLRPYLSAPLRESNSRRSV